jgi:hypothetical protein
VEENETATTTNQTDYQRFLSEPKLDVDKNAVNWWKEYDSKFPKLAKLVRKYFSVPATSVPSERVFSCAGQIVTKKRNALLPENVDMLIFLAQNLKQI